MNSLTLSPVISIKQFISNHKKQCVIGTVLMAVMMFVLFLPAFAFGEKAIESFLKGWVETIFAGGMTDDVQKIILANPVTKYADAWTAMTNIYNNAILPIAFALMSLFLVISIINQSVKLDQLTAAQFIKPFVMYLVTFIVMKHGMDILIYLIYIGQSIANKITVGTTASMSGMIDMANKMVENEVDGLISGIFMVVQLALPWMAAVILGFAVKIVCYTRVFEIYLKTMLAPFGMCDVITNGVDSRGLRFFKNYFATCLQAAVIVGVSSIYSLLMGNIIADYMSGAPESYTLIGMTGVSLVMGFAALSMMIKAGSIAKEVIGA